MNINKEFIFIYNVEQGLFYLMNGLMPVDYGTGNKGDAFLKFKNDEKYRELFDRWCVRK